MLAAAVPVFFAALLISALATPGVRGAAIRLGHYDQTHGSRKIHSRPVPRLGGLGFILGIYGALVAAATFEPVRTAMLRDGPRLLVLGLSGIGIAAIGVWDDLRGANARQKLAVQLAVALALHGVGYSAQSIENPFGADLELGALALPVTVLWIVGVCNAMNLIDGLDGLAGGMGLVAAAVVVVLAVHAGDLPHALVATATAGGLAGFLIYNVNPASIFMGDSGSLFLGTILAALALSLGEHGARGVPLAPMVLALGVPIADTLLAISRRAARGAPVFSADREHIHHRLLDSGLSQREAVMSLWAAAGGLACAAVGIAFARQGRELIFVCALGAGVAALSRIGMIRVPSPELPGRRRRNRERFRAIRAVCGRIRGAEEVSDLHDQVGMIAPIIEARTVLLRLSAEGSEAPSYGPSVEARSFPIDSMRPERGTIDVSWPAGSPSEDRDAEIVVEILCRHLRGALQRMKVTNGSTGPAERGRPADGRFRAVVGPAGKSRSRARRCEGDLDETHPEDDLPANDVLGVPVSGLSLSASLDLAFGRIRARHKTLFTTANAHSIVLAQRLPGFAAHFREADTVLADGISAVWGARACGGGVRQRVSGPDFFEGFLERAAEEEVSVFLVGTDEATLRRLEDRCKARLPRLVIKGTIAPPYGELSPEVNRCIVASVNRARPDALFVAMTAPKQELWLSRHLRDLDVAFAMGVGAAFDFTAGTRRRAPPLIGRLGLEWLFRLALEPRRLWRRNLDSLVLLMLLARSMMRRRERRAVRCPEGRTTSRYPARRAVRLGDVSARTVNISQGGLCLEVDGSIPRSARVRGSIRLGRRDIPFVGRVVWTIGRSRSSPRRIGLRFTEAPADLARIAGLGRVGGAEGDGRGDRAPSTGTAGG